MKKILLFADIGGHEQERYYHVGDEAMFYETYLWYKDNHPDWEISALTWFKNNDHYINFAPHLLWSQRPSWAFFLFFVVKVFIYKVFNLSLLSASEFSWLSTVISNDVIHFTGGGNLSSNFRKWLYYCFLVLLIAKVFNKKVILTSQTIGPFNKIDLQIAKVLLNQASIIGIRSKINRREFFNDLNLSQSKLISMLDSAYTKQKNKNKKKPRNYFLIGLSIHEWKNSSKETHQLINSLIQKIRKKYQIRIILIPHHLTTNGVGDDVTFMSKMLSSAKNNQKTWNLFCRKISKHTVPANLIKSITSRIDLLITSRYHGLVFALSQNVPAIALNYDRYYQIKNNGILEMIYDSNPQNYSIELKDENALLNMFAKCDQLLRNNFQEKAKLAKINEKKFSSENTLNSVMEKLSFDD
ncbi:polysaccharide pyruvyl transferase family protein [Patescibacteria group bacterium]|nr:polysaccharide pyruvyl transferase family protein [Patescibacteria group bacterium]